MGRQWTEDMIFGRVEVPALTDEGDAAVETLRTLDEKVTAVFRKVRTPSCWFRESARADLRAGDGREVVAGGRGEVRQGRAAVPARRATAVVASSTRPRRSCRPTNRRTSGRRRGCRPVHLPYEWRRVLRNRKRRLAMLLRTAAELEEEVRYGR